MEPPQRFPQLLDFSFGNVLLVLGFRKLVRNLVKIAEHTFQDFTDSFYLRAGLENPRTLLRREVTVGATRLFAFGLGMRG
jgi:hypothetical protein